MGHMGHRVADTIFVQRESNDPDISYCKFTAKGFTVQQVVEQAKYPKDTETGEMIILAREGSGWFTIWDKGKFTKGFEPEKLFEDCLQTYRNGNYTPANMADGSTSISVYPRRAE